MATTTIVWAGKELGGDEEARLRHLVHQLRRIGNHELAGDFERFLPEHENAWTPEERAVGVRMGDDFSISGRMDGDSGIRLDDSA